MQKLMKKDDPEAASAPSDAEAELGLGDLLSLWQRLSKGESAPFLRKFVKERLLGDGMIGRRSGGPRTLMTSGNGYCAAANTGVIYRNFWANPNSYEYVLGGCYD